MIFPTLYRSAAVENSGRLGRNRRFSDRRNYRIRHTDSSDHPVEQHAALE